MESLESSNRKASKNGLRAVISIWVVEQRGVSYPLRGHLNQSGPFEFSGCLRRSYTVAAFSPGHAFGAGATPGRGEQVVGDLMIKYDDQTSLLSYYILVMVTKSLMKS